MQQRLETLAFLLGRLMLASLFVLEGVSKVRGYGAAEAYMARFSVPPALLPVVIVVEIGGGLLLATGLSMRLASLALAVFCLLAAVIFHADFGLRGEVLQFEKDIALAGALLALAALGRPTGQSADAL